MKTTKKSLLALLLALVMLFQLAPTAAWAESPGDAAERRLEEARRSGDRENFISRPERKEYQAEDVLFELEELREAEVKQFHMADGNTLAVSYGYPVHVPAADGGYRDIDNRLTLYNADGSPSREEPDAVLRAWQEERQTAAQGGGGREEADALGPEDLRYYRNNAGLAELRFSVLSNAPELVRFAYDGFSVSLTPQHPDSAERGAEPPIPAVGRIDELEEGRWDDGSLASAIVPRNICSSLTYRNVFEQTDLQYILSETSLKENIVIRSRADHYVYTFLLETDGLKPELGENGSVALLDEEGRCVMHIPAGYMFDAAGERSAAVRYELRQQGGQTYLSVLADPDWINAEERQFPVTVDPTVTIDWDTGIEISTICSGSPNADHYDIPYPDIQNIDETTVGFVGLHPNDGVRKLRTLIHVGTLPTIPANSTIVDGRLKLYSLRYFYWGDLLPMLVEARPLTENEPCNGSWCKYHCWNDCPPLSDTVLEYYPTRNEYKEVYVDVTGEAVKWYNDPTTNTGICLRSISEGWMSNGFYGYELIASIDVAYSNFQRPFFLVTYRNTAGLEERLSYQTQDIARAGTAYVGDYSGQMTLVKSDVNEASTANPVSLSHVYNTAYCAGEFGASVPGCTGQYANMKLGAGWKLSLQQSVVQVDDTTLAYVDGDGSRHYFLDPYETEYLFQDEDGAGLRIIRSGTNYTLSDRYGNSSYFENGILRYSQDSNGNRIDVLRNNEGQITSVTRTNSGGSAETVATLSYNNDGYLTGITNSAGKTTAYSYDQDGRLSTVTHPDGTTAGYTYDASGRMTGAADNERGYSVSYSYHANTGKITGFSETANNVTGASVAVDGTRNGVQVYRSSGPDRALNTADDLLTTYVFDYWGRTINSNTTSADRLTVYGASAGKYTANSGISFNNNRLLVSSTAGLQSPNMIRDPGAEGMSAIGAATTPWSCTGTAGVETSLRHTGRKALKLSGAGSLKQTVTGLEPGGWYVLSAYVNTAGVTSFGTGGVYMACGSVRGEPIRWSTAGVGDGWERVYVAAQADANGSLTLEARTEGITGSAVFDDFQVEGTAFGALGTPSAASLLENGAMEDDDAWNVWVEGYHRIGQDPGLSGYGLKVTGIVDECIDVYQSVEIDRPGTETYLFTGWIQGHSVPLEHHPELGQRDFSLAVQVFYTDDTEELQEMDFNVQTSEWQYMAFPVVPQYPEKQVDFIRVMASVGRNPNTVFFDNFTLTREEAQTYAYNSSGDLVSVTQPGTATPTFSYSGADLMSQVTRGSGTYEYSYDNSHNVTGVSNDGLSMSVSYDARGNTAGTTLTGTGTSLRLVSSASYDSAGDRLLSQTDSRGGSVSYLYETAVSRMLGAPTRVTDPAGTVSTTGYDADNGRVTGSAVLNGNGTEASLAYTYSGGFLTAMTRTALLPGGGSFTQSYGMSYNAFGQTLGISVGNLSLASYVYGANGGALQSMTYGNGDSVSYAYDALERIQNVYYNNSSDPSLTYGYAANGALGSLTDHDNQRRCSYGYDGLDRLLSMTETFDGEAVQIFHADYDSANRVSDTSYRVSPGWDGTLRDARAYGYTYSDSNGSLSAMSLPGGGAYGYSYDALRRLSSRSLSLNNSVFLTRSYGYLAGAGTNDATLLVNSLEIRRPNGSTLRSWSYTYDAAGRITSVSDGTETWSYTYDLQGQLLTETKGTGQNAQTWTYSYDTAGNLRGVTHGGNSVSYSYTNAQWADLLTVYDGQSISYDAIGNPTTWYDGATMTWEHGRRLASIGATNGHAALSFGYGADGLRLWKTVGTGQSAVEHRYTWQGDKLIAEAWGDTELEFFYDESGRPYALLVRNNGVTPAAESWYYYVTDLRGDVALLLDASGNTAAEYSYNAWGEVLSATGTMAAVNPLRYRGYYYDAETKLYYLQSRYYDPQLCRFLNADGLASTGQGILGTNMFAYCGNDPVAGCDRTGMFDWEKAGLIALSAIEVIGGAVLIAYGAYDIGSPILSAGASSLLNGIFNEKSGGSFIAGWLGGEFGGALNGVGLSVASQCLEAEYYGSAFVFGASGGFVGGFSADSITQIMDDKPFDINHALKTGSVSAAISSLAVPFLGIPSAIQVYYRSLAGAVAAISEMVFDLLAGQFGQEANKPR